MFELEDISEHLPHSLGFKPKPIWLCSSAGSQTRLEVGHTQVCPSSRYVRGTGSRRKDELEDRHIHPEEAQSFSWSTDPPPL